MSSQEPVAGQEPVGLEAAEAKVVKAAKEAKAAKADRAAMGVGEGREEAAGLPYVGSQQIVVPGPYGPQYRYMPIFIPGGKSGDSGRAGQDGSEGAKGSEGQRGRSGSRGEDGASGPEGRPGESGSPGSVEIVVKN